MGMIQSVSVDLRSLMSSAPADVKLVQAEQYSYLSLGQYLCKYNKTVSISSFLLDLQESAV